MAYIDQATKRAEILVAAIRDNKDLTEATRQAVLEYTNFMRANGLSDRTISKNLYCLATFLKTIGSKDLLTLTKQDIMASMAMLERTAYSAKTKQNVKITVKSFFKHAAGEDEYYPANVRWIKSTIKNSQKYLPDDILLESDVLAMLNVTGDVRNSALIALLYDSGIRVGELLNMKVKDVDLDANPGHIRVSGKTGTRIIPILFSVPYMARLLDSYVDKQPDSFLWAKQGTWINHKEPMDRDGIAKVLKKAATAAGIKKPINPHAWRHARATYYANRLSDQQLKSFFGWTGGSRMAETYVALSGRDLDDGILEANGQPGAVKQEPKLKSMPCPKCRMQNPASSSYCSRCGAPMNIETALNEERVRNLRDKAAIDPKELDEFIAAYKEWKKAKK